MANYRFDVDNGTTTGTVVPDVGWRVAFKLNNVNELELKFSGTGTKTRELLKTGAKVRYYKNGTLEMLAIIDKIDYLIGGTVIAHASGYEVWLGRENGTYSSSPWTSTASATIFSSLINESSYLTAGTIDAGMTIDYRVNQGTSIWNAITNLARKTQQDIEITYTSTSATIGIRNHIGSSTSVAVLNDGTEITNLRKTVGYPRGNKIIVYGKGDGDTQITGTASDATSIATYGEITKTIIDRSVMTEAEANALANAELAINKNPPNIYDFELTNPEFTGINLGDVITLNSQDVDVNNEEVRVVGIEIGMRGGALYKTLQTTNPELKTLMLTKNQILAHLVKNNQDSNTYMQGNTVTSEYGIGINADSSHHAKLAFYIPPDFKTETGALKVLFLKADFDIDPFNSQYGTATFTGSDPQVQNSSANTEPNVSGTSGSTTPTATAGVSVWAAFTVWYDNAHNMSLTYANENLVGSPSYYSTRLQGLYMNVTGSTQTVDRSISAPSGSSWSSSYSLGNNQVTNYYVGESSSSNTSGWAKFWDDNFACSGATGTIQNIYSHTHGSHSHGDGSYTAANHYHTDGSYDINAADIDHISIGDGVSEAGTVNATGATLYLDYWDGSSWINKYSKTLTSTLETDIDMTDSGTYPDNYGYWRIRVEPNSSNPDFVNLKVRIKFKIDN